MITVLYNLTNQTDAAFVTILRKISDERCEPVTTTKMKVDINNWTETYCKGEPRCSDVHSSVLEMWSSSSEI